MKLFIMSARDLKIYFFLDYWAISTRVIIFPTLKKRCDEHKFSQFRANFANEISLTFHSGIYDSMICHHSESALVTGVVLI